LARPASLQSTPKAQRRPGKDNGDGSGTPGEVQADARQPEGGTQFDKQRFQF
jgi:hypothetical protein